MRDINFAVCDDEEIICNAVYAKAQSFFKLCGIKASGLQFCSPEALLDYVRNMQSQYRLDLVFLDIDMPKLNGLDLGKIIRGKSETTEIIFVSARYDKVFETFGIHPYGFIRKNNFNNDFNTTMKAYVKDYCKQESIISVSTDNNSVVRNIRVNEIIFIESFRAHQVIHLDGGEDIEVRMTMDDLEQKLAQYDIVRTHKSYLVNYQYVSRIDTEGILLKNGVMTPVSRKRIKEIRTDYIKYLNKTGRVFLEND